MTRRPPTRAGAPSSTQRANLHPGGCAACGSACGCRLDAARRPLPPPFPAHAGRHQPRSAGALAAAQLPDDTPCVPHAAVSGAHTQPVPTQPQGHRAPLGGTPRISAPPQPHAHLEPQRCDRLYCLASRSPPCSPACRRPTPALHCRTRTPSRPRGAAPRPSAPSRQAALHAATQVAACCPTHLLPRPINPILPRGQAALPCSSPGLAFCPIPPRCHPRPARRVTRRSPRTPPTACCCTNRPASLCSDCDTRVLPGPRRVGCYAHRLLRVCCYQRRNTTTRKREEGAGAGGACSAWFRQPRRGAPPPSSHRRGGRAPPRGAALSRRADAPNARRRCMSQQRPRAGGP